jgi:hypothetical protein
MVVCKNVLEYIIALVVVKNKVYILRLISGADPGFQVRGADLNKLRRVEGGANIFGVFRVAFPWAINSETGDEKVNYEKLQFECEIIDVVRSSYI